MGSSLLDSMVLLSVFTAVGSALAYFLVYYMFEVQYMACFGSVAGTKPLIEHQITRDVSYVFSVTGRLEKVRW